MVEEATFDRSLLSHKVNLFDMHLKYASVLHLDEVLQYLAGLRPEILEGARACRGLRAARRARTARATRRSPGTLTSTSGHLARSSAARRSPPDHTEVCRHARSLLQQSAGDL